MSSESALGKADSSSTDSGKEFLCAVCGSEHNSQRGLSIHESKKHGGPVDNSGIECPGCDRSFSCQRGVIAHLTGKNSCGGGYECSVCGRTHPTERGLNYHKKETHDIDTRPKIACSICGDERRVDHNYAKKDIEDHLCSNECWSEWAAENRTGPGNPTWKGGKVLYYGTNWKNRRLDALERDNHTCQACGQEDNLHVHHIRPLRTFDDGEKPHRLRNLVTLCRSCHKTWEGIPLKPQLL